MQNEPLTNARYPDNGDAADVALYIEQAVKDLADNTIPNFTSTAQRDSKFSDWVAQGNTMRNGLHCWVGTTRYVYISGAWVADPTGSQVRAVRMQRNPDTDNFPSGSWTDFSSNTNWSATDPWGMKSTGGAITAPWTGVYDFSATIHWTPNGTGGRGLALSPATGVNIGAGGGALIYLAQVAATPGGSLSTIVSGSYKTQLTAGNTVKLAGWQNSGSGLTVDAARMSVAYLGSNT